MGLNCKPGDLARIISTESTEYTGIVDKIVKVTDAATVDGCVVWRYEGPALRCVCGCYQGITGIGDVLLRPIRGQDGDDETLTWAGLPATLDTPVAA